MAEERRFAGGCLCGGVRFVVTGDMREIIACHCGQCQRFHGNFAAYTACPEERLAIGDTRLLAWYESSPSAKRGFCKRCGSSLFWKPSAAGYVAVAAGALDDPQDLRLERHIFTADRPSWYAITDGLEEFRGSMSQAASGPG